ncbi:MAG: Uma2 family endonuclease [Limnoraphis sp. WC205]|jgi:Uma2 family endonuclease|nr:Uma2 family endonuclease [Limnoraphis sp. WC205]
MVYQAKTPSASEIFYPDCDGQPMANNTIQFRWILVIEQNLDWLFSDDPNVFVAGDLFWYPIEGNNTINNAPDVMVVLGRPKGDRRSYKQWEEEGIAPQVVFEILSPSNSRVEMDRKLLFYERYGVEEYYIYNPENKQLQGWLRGEYGLEIIELIENWVSPRMKIRFDLSGEELQIYRPDNTPFYSYNEVRQMLEQERLRAEQERLRAEQAEQARRDAIPRLLEMGLTVEQVAEALGLSVEEVNSRTE